MRAVILSDNLYYRDRVYSPAVRQEIQAAFDLVLPPLAYEDLEAHRETLREVEVIFSTWGMPPLDGEEIDRLFPSLRAVLYAAGAVTPFAAPFMERGIRVCSARDANAIAVAEVAEAEILLGLKGYYYLSALSKQAGVPVAKESVGSFPGVYRAHVGIVGMGNISRRVIRALVAKGVTVHQFSTYATEEDIRALGAIPETDLGALFAGCTVVSNHLGNTPDTVGIIGREALSRMGSYSTFINTGRGPQVDEAALAEALAEDPTRVAVLDVTSPEPPREDSPFYSLPNVVLTPHFAGGLGENELIRMAEFMIEDGKRLVAGMPLLYEVSPAELAHMPTPAADAATKKEDTK